MAKWNQTDEPNVKVIESVKETPLNIDAGGDLIIGGVIRTTAGPLTPTYIAGKKSLLDTFTVNGELTADDDITLLNAYRLAGTNSLLLCRASGLNGCIYLREIKESDLNEYVYKQGEILKKVTEVSISITEDTKPWKVDIEGVGTMGKDPSADLYVATLTALVSQLNETDKFHIPNDSYSLSEDGKKLTFRDIFTSSNPFITSHDPSDEGFDNVELTISNSFSLKNYVMNMNSTAGTLDITIIKTTSDDGLDRVIYQIDTVDGTEEQTFVIGTDKEDGEITLEDFNELYGDVIQIVCPDGLDSISFPTNGSGKEAIHIDLKIPSTSNLLATSDRDYQKAWDLIQTEERYVVEGFCDLGECNTANQNYIAAAARSLNAFYPISPCRAVNYMVIANHFSKITAGANDMVLYKIAPWDEDDGTLGFEFDCSPAVLYWERVAINRSNNNEFAAVMGEIRGVVSPVHLATEFNRKEREMLLTKRINTIFNDMALDSIYINDCYTAQANKNIMQEENNVRMKIRISRAMPVLLSQFRGRQSNVKTWNEVTEVIDYWFKSTILPMNYTIADYRIQCDSTLNPPEVQRANKLYVRVQVRYYSNIRWITVYHDALI